MNVLIVLQCLTFAAIVVAARDQEIQGGSKCPDGNSLVGLCKAKCTVFKQRQILGETGRPHCAKTLLKDG